MKGRSTKSPVLKKLQGNTRRRAKVVKQRDDDGEALAAPLENSGQKLFFSPGWEPPSWLSLGARKIWCEQLPIARRETKLQESGLTIFAAYCDALFRLQKYSAEIETLGATYTTASGYVRKRPEVEMRDRAANDVRNFASELNLTPKSWIGSMGTFSGRQLDMFMHGGRVQSAPEAPGLAGTPPKGDGLDAFLGAKPTMQ